MGALSVDKAALRVIQYLFSAGYQRTSNMADLNLYPPASVNPEEVSPYLSCESSQRALRPVVPFSPTYAELG